MLIGVGHGAGGQGLVVDGVGDEGSYGCVKVLVCVVVDEGSLFVSVLELGWSHWPRVMAAGFVKYTFVSLVSLVLVMSSTGFVVGDKERAVIEVVC